MKLGPDVQDTLLPVGNIIQVNLWRAWLPHNSAYDPLKGVRRLEWSRGLDTQLSLGEKGSVKRGEDKHVCTSVQRRESNSVLHFFGRRTWT